MQRLSAPKHRHDGTSPLPLGMDWSPPPRLWEGRETIWPHNPRTGWSYCVTIPTWVVLAKSRDSDPTVFYRVQVGIQSPEGITTTRTVLRRFNNFLKLHAALKRVFPWKNLPPTPSKGLWTMKTRSMLEGRRSSLEEWLTKLLSEIDLSRSVAVASFLELEAAARSSFQEENPDSSNSRNSLNAIVSSLQTNPNLSLSTVAGSSSLASDYGSETAYETSEIGTPSLGRDNNSETGTEDLLLDEDLTSPMDKFVKYGMSNIDEGLSIGQAILGHLEGFPRQKLHAEESHRAYNNLNNGSSSKAPHQNDEMLEVLSEPGYGSKVGHVWRISKESIGSDTCSRRNSDLSNIALTDSNGYDTVDFRSVPEIIKTGGTIGALDFELPNNVQLFLPFDQCQKLNRVLTTMHQRLVTAKTDMEDLISRLNQEVAVKDYLATKVKDLEVKLETTRQQSKENLEQALLIERERVTQMQWDMEELRQSSMEMKLKLNSQESHGLDAECATTVPHNHQRDELQLELESSRLQFQDLLEQHQQLEMKSKSDTRILVKEVKALRSAQAELKMQFSQLLEEKSKAVELLHEESVSYEQIRICWRKLLLESKMLHSQLQECTVNYATYEKGDVSIDVSSLVNPVEFLASSDNQVDRLITQVQRLAQDAEYSTSASDESKHSNHGTISVDEELKRVLTSILIHNGVLRKEVNSLLLHCLRMNKLLNITDSGSPLNTLV